MSRRRWSTYGSVIVGDGAYVREDFVQSSKDRSRVDEFLRVTRQSNATGDERLLSVQPMGCDGHGSLPILFEADVLGFRRTGTETDITVRDLEVVGDITFGAVENGLGDPDGVGVSELGDDRARVHSSRQGVDPFEAEVAHAFVGHVRSLPGDGPFSVADARFHLS